MAQVPVVDMSAFVPQASPTTRREAAAELAQSVRRHGCVGITGHGLDAEVLQTAFQMARAMFQLPMEDKMKAPHPAAPKPHRGFSRAGLENVAGKSALETNDVDEKHRLQKLADCKETYDIGSEDNVEQPNIWLPDSILPGYRSFMVDFYSRLNGVCQKILDALMMGIGLTEDECDAVRQLHTGVTNQLRLAHYLPLSGELLAKRDLTRLAPHRDWSCFTLLFQDSRGGLEFQNRETGQFMPATPQQDLLYMNVGDMLERLSNGLFPSCLHRVVVPRVDDAKDTTPSRFSIPYFFSPSGDGLIAPQQSLVKVDGKANYKPITFKEYANMMFRATQSQRQGG